MKLIWVILIVALAPAAMIYLTRPPKLEFTLEEAQKNGTTIARYWLDQAKVDNLANMKAACTGSAVNQSERMLNEIHKSEKFAGIEFGDYSIFSMGGGGALKAILTGAEAGVVMQMILFMKEEDGKWWVTRITTD